MDKIARPTRQRLGRDGNVSRHPSQVDTGPCSASENQFRWKIYNFSPRFDKRSSSFGAFGGLFSPLPSPLRRVDSSKDIQGAGMKIFPRCHNGAACGFSSANRARGEGERAKNARARLRVKQEWSVRQRAC